MKKILETVYHHIIKDKSRIIGITGIDCSGKSHFAQSVSDYLSSQKIQNIVVHVDDFLYEKSIRYQSEDEIENYFFHTFNYKKLVLEILEPVKTGQVVDIELDLLDENTDKYISKKEFKITENALVILEGVFLLRDAIRKYLDYTIFLDIDISRCLERADIRDKDRWDENIEARYKRKYIPTQRMYLNKYDPKILADIIIDNNNFDRPLIKDIVG